MTRRVDQWKWSSYLAMVGEDIVPGWLASDYLLSQFSVQRKTAIRKYMAFVQDGLRRDSIWAQLNNQIYLGDQNFIDSLQQHIGEKEKDLQIPKIQKRSIAKTIQEYAKMSSSRDEAIVKAYDSGAYSYHDLGEYFGLHFTRIGKIVRMNRGNI